MTREVKFYYVGGYVRDRILGVPNKDIDFTVEAESYEAMRDHIAGLERSEIFLETPEYHTIRARIGKDTHDFVLARKDGPYTDGRHPDWTKPGDIYDDLARRDFTMNAIALAVNPDDYKGYIDPHGGEADIALKLIRAVGDPEKRIAEDPLRVFRALRFSVTKDFRIDADLSFAMRKVSTLNSLDGVSTERIREEMFKMFKHDSTGSMILLVNHYPMYLPILEDRGLWFEPTTRKK